MAKKRKTFIGRDMNDNLVTVGNRVEISPSFDLWMRGARFGHVVRTRGTSESPIFCVKMDNARVRKQLCTTGDRLKVVRGGALFGKKRR